MPAVLPPRLVGSTFSNNPPRPVIIIPSVNKDLTASSLVPISVGTTDEKVTHFAQVYDESGKLIGSEELKLLGSAGDGVVSGTVTTTGALQQGSTYFIRVYAFVNGEEVSHTIALIVP